MNRRGFLTGLAGIIAAGAAPAIVQAGSIMRVRPIVLPGEREWYDYAQEFPRSAGIHRMLNNGVFTERELANIANAMLDYHFRHVTKLGLSA